jgi:hypothetical protein
VSKNEKALLLIGSPKGEASTSASLGNYLASRLEEFGMISEKGYIHRLVNREEKIQDLFRMVDNADLIILAFPLYVDSLPAPVIKAMELIKEQRDTLERKDPKNFVAISNSGFPEAFQSTVALQICRIFSNECGFVWKGGIVLGGGGSLDGAPLPEKGGMVRNIIKGLDIAASALKDGNDIPQEALDLVAKKIIAYALYRMFGNLGWKIQARRHGVKKRLRDRPYLNRV